MFFTNEIIKYVLLDYDYISKPDALISDFKGSGFTVHLLVSEEHPKYSKETADLIAKKKIFAYGKMDTSRSRDLRRYFNQRPKKFEDVFITEDPERVRTANSIQIGTVLISQDFSFDDVRSGADLVVKRKDIPLIVENKFYIGYTGEILLNPVKHLLPGYNKSGPLRKYLVFKPKHDEFETAYSLGRYFSSNDTFLSFHLYSRFIKTFKSDPNRFEKETNLILSQGLKNIVKRENLGEDFVTSFVPKKPDDTFDRNEIMIKNLLKVDKSYNLKRTLVCPAQYPSQKEAGNFLNRKANVEDKYEMKDGVDVEGKAVILIDDLYTSGETMAECARKLLAAGATKVIPFTLAFVCDENTVPTLSLSCPLCQDQVTIYFKTRNAEAFWKCVNFKTCADSYMAYEDGVKALRKLWKDAEEISF